jgi:spore coat polysaccharide biosynthesis protein SpsF
MLERLARGGVGPVVVATTVLSRDDGIVELAASLGVRTVRGSEEDVLGRFALALDTYPAETVVRLTADSPLIDPDIVKQVLLRHRITGADYTSNTLVRTFPDGLDVEVLESAALRESAREATDPYEREHVTAFVYRRPDRYRLASVRSSSDAGSVTWTVDTRSDLERVRAIVDQLDDPASARWCDILAAVRGKTHLR